jgi:hypothetical protein
MSWQDDFVQAVNPTDEPIEWDGYVYQPGQRRMVPFLSMTNSYGDPRAVPGMPKMFRSPSGETGVVQSREIQRNKISVAWNAGSGPGYSITWDDIPKLQFFNVDGDRIFTVYDDPLGNKIMPADTTIEHQQDLERQVKSLTQQVRDLSRLAGINETDIPTDDSAGIPSDVPTDDSTTDETQSPWYHSEDEADIATN